MVVFSIQRRVARVEHQGGTYPQKPNSLVSLVNALCKGVGGFGRENAIDPAFHHRGRRTPGIRVHDCEEVGFTQLIDMQLYERIKRRGTTLLIGGQSWNRSRWRL